MIEFVRHIEYYSNYWYSTFSKIVTNSEWGNKKIAEQYLRKYWLNEKEYNDFWKPIQNNIFIENVELPNLIFQPNFKILPIIGGCLFIKKDFEEFQMAIKKFGESHFVVIQNTQDFTIGEPMFRMKFPIDVTWDELISGNFISSILLEMNYNEYYIFGESAIWGRYSATEYEHPLDIIGIKQECSSFFKGKFNPYQQEKNQINNLLPLEYKKLLLNL